MKYGLSQSTSQSIRIWFATITFALIPLLSFAADPTIKVTELGKKFPGTATGPMHVPAIAHTISGDIFIAIPTKDCLEMAKSNKKKCPKAIPHNQECQYTIFRLRRESGESGIYHIDRVFEPIANIEGPIPLHADRITGDVYAGVAPFNPDKGDKSQLVIHHLRAPEKDQSGGSPDYLVEPDYVVESVMHSAKWDFAIDDTGKYGVFFVNGADATPEIPDVWRVDLKSDRPATKPWESFDFFKKSDGYKIVYPRIDYAEDLQVFVLSWHTALIPDDRNLRGWSAHIAIYDHRRGTLANVAGKPLDHPVKSYETGSATEITTASEHPTNVFVLGTVVKGNLFYLLYHVEFKPGEHTAFLNAWNLRTGEKEIDRKEWPKEKLHAWRIGLVSHPGGGLAAVGIDPGTSLERKSFKRFGVAYEIHTDTGELGRELSHSDKPVVDKLNNYTMVNERHTDPEGVFYAISGGHDRCKSDNTVRLWEGRLPDTTDTTPPKTPTDLRVVPQ